MSSIELLRHARLPASLRGALACALAVLALCAPPALGVTLETLVMPGPVIEGHAEYETQCDKCHVSFDKARQRALCMDCHDDIASDVRRERGFHGRISGIDSAQCNQCHTDHEGRDADIVQLSVATFDHQRTDFALKDAHARLKCNACHALGESYRDAPSACVDCHTQADPHEGRLGRQCDDCHDQVRWADAPFDHSTTEFALEDGHKDVACAQCHAGQRYEGTPLECYACHRVNDIHNARYGQECEQCHGASEWQDVSFDHDVDTEFPLVARHLEVACDTCHRGHLFDDTLLTTCFACHEADDNHSGRNGEQCDECHDEKSWTRPAFDHDEDTSFALTGGHADLTCEACHRGNVYEEKLESRCVACHALDDVHGGSLGQRCDECHATSSWERVRFNHDTDTDFALRGGHSELACEDCHSANGAREPLPVTCHSCHQKDDVHNGKQGEDCARCHDEQSWGERVFFDHDLTRFPLIGQHAVAPCEECHASAEYKNTPIACIECHGVDDAHEDRFGADCGACHNPNGWPLWRFDHAREADYPLTGAHDGLDCHACHVAVGPDGGYAPLAQDCFSCHRRDDVHKGSFGRRCDECHVPDSFDDVQIR